MISCFFYWRILSNFQPRSAIVLVGWKVSWVITALVVTKCYVLCILQLFLQHIQLPEHFWTYTRWSLNFLSLPRQLKAGSYAHTHSSRSDMIMLFLLVVGAVLSGFLSAASRMWLVETIDPPWALGEYKYYHIFFPCGKFGRGRKVLE